jgi:putative aldouronate transport system permease protein
LEKTKTKEPRLKIGKYNVSRIRESLELYVLLALPVVFLFFMVYAPMPGIAIAFQDFKLGQKNFIFGDNIKWVGLKHFKSFVEGKYFERLMGNTLRISIKNLLLTFPLPIIFALLLNEIKHMRTKKIIQTASYLPHFISTVVVAGMVLSFLEADGLITGTAAKLLGTPNTNPLMKGENFDMIYILTCVWMSFGFDSILYLSAISGVDQELYEAARLDGATRWQQVWYITLPGILPTVSIMLVMSIGSILGTNTDLILNMYNAAIYEKADCIGTYVYRMGLGVEGGSGLPKYSATSAIGLFSAVINITLLFIANTLSNWLTDTGLW